MIRPKNLHIIIAEDDSDDREIIEDSFGQHGAFVRVDIVKNGKELIDFLRNEHPKPDVILTDINMPIMDGIEALSEICGDPQLHHIPAFVYSTTINPTYETKCMELGTRGFLVKPFSLQGFVEIPEKIVDILAVS